LKDDKKQSFKKISGLIELWRRGDKENHRYVHILEDRFNRYFIAPAAIKAAFEVYHLFITLDRSYTKS
jgi:hypothetical protein